MRGFNEKLFGDKLVAGQLPINLGLIGSEDVSLLLLDLYPNAAAAYSLRKLKATYTGNAIRVRRTNLDEIDIGFTSTGALDTTALVAFTGTGALDNGFITTWYDQSGNARNATQTTAINQPQIVNSGSVILENGYPFLQYNTTPVKYLRTSFSFNISTPLQLFFISKNTRVGVSYLYDFTIKRATSFYNPDIQIFNGNSIASGNSSTNVLISSHLFNGANSQIYVNSSLLVTGNAGNNGAEGNLLIGARFNVADQLIGGFQEFIIYSSNQSSNRTGIENNINDFYSIY
jgi:hypothetical protein